MRKNYIASLEDRTPEEIAEEEALFVELKRLEQNERKFRKERDDLLRTLLGVDSGLPDIVVEEDGPAALSIDLKKKNKKGTGLDIDFPPTPSNIIQLGPPITKKPPAKSAVYGETKVLSQSLQFIRLQTHNTASFGSNHLPVRPTRPKSLTSLSTFVVSNSRLPRRPLHPRSRRPLLSWVLHIHDWSCQRGTIVLSWNHY